MTGLTYLQFHAALVLPAVALLVAAATVSRPRAGGRTVWSVGGYRYWVGVAVVTAVAVLYTAPWDSYLIARGVWRYGEGRTGARLARTPVGEYLFFVLQPLLVATWLGQLRRRDGWPEPGPIRGPDGRRRLDVAGLAMWPRIAGAFAGLAVGLLGLGLVLLPPTATFYLGAILAWSGPVLALQWGVGVPPLWHQRSALALGVAVPTAYLWVLDRLALAAGVWEISAAHTVGVAPFGLPVEEAVFFLVTTLFVVQGLLCFQWVMDGWRG
jgi:lycopene cyclase domain-containing protein